MASAGEHVVAGCGDGGWMSGDAGSPLVVEVAELADGVDLVTLRGELDVSSGAEASAALAGSSGEGRGVVVDVSGLKFVDSSGVKMLVAAARAVEDAGGVFVVCAASEPVRRVIGILHLDQVVTVVDRREDAVAEVVRARQGGPGNEVG
jgi:anti-anti-sigma factor